MASEARDDHALARHRGHHRHRYRVRVCGDASVTTIAARAGAAHRMTRKPRLATLPPRLTATDFRSVKPEPKQADPELQTPEHRAWRAEVLKRAGYRCEWVEDGVRCDRNAARDRLVADHIVERKDGGAL